MPYYDEFDPEKEELFKETPYDSISAREPLSDVSKSPLMEEEGYERDPAGFLDRLKSQFSGDAHAPEIDPANRPPYFKPEPPMPTPALSGPMPQRDVVKAAIAKKMAPRPAAAPVRAQAAPIPEAREPERTPAIEIEDDFNTDPYMVDYNEREADLNDFRKATMKSNFIKNYGQASDYIAYGADKSPDTSEFYRNLNKQDDDLLTSKDRDLTRRQQIINAIENRKLRESISNQNFELRKSMAGVKQENKGKEDGHKTDVLMSGMANHFDNDPIMKPSMVNLAALNKSRAILNGKAPLTSQSLSDAESDIATAVNFRPQPVTEGKIKRTEIETLDRMIGDLKQKFGGSMSDMRKEAPEVVEQIRKLNDILTNDYIHAINQRTDELSAERKSLIGNPEAHKRLDNWAKTKKLQPLPEETSSQSGMVRVRRPDNGKVYEFPEGSDQLKRALRSGGKRL